MRNFLYLVSERGWGGSLGEGGSAGVCVLREPRGGGGR